MTSEVPEPVDVRNNPESRAYAADTGSPVSRANEGGAVPREAPEAGELPEAETGGTAEGNPVAGLEIDKADLEEAFSADEGPLELGQEGPDLSNTRNTNR